MILIVIIILLLIGLFLVVQFKKPPSGNGKKVAIALCIKNPKNIETWLKLHRDFGISRFYIRLEDTPELVEYLKAQSDVNLIVGDSNSVDEYVDLMSRQSKMVDTSIELCKKDGIDWLIHIDCDEVLEGNLEEIQNLPNNVGTFWMQNYEVKYDKIPSETDSCFMGSKFVDCSKGLCASYANGKGGGRVGVSLSNGPHRFKSNLKEVKLRSVIVKHFESCDFDQYIAKYKRLAKSNVSEIPFPYYKESILAEGDVNKLSEIYTKYRVSNS
jgi:hypothetical protein